MFRTAVVAASLTALFLTAPHAWAGPKGPSGGTLKVEWLTEEGEQAAVGSAHIVDLRSGDSALVALEAVHFSRSSDETPIVAVRFPISMDGAQFLPTWMNHDTALALELTLFTPEGKPLRYKLDRCFVKSWSISGDADDRPTEEVAFYYNKIAFLP